MAVKRFVAQDMRRALDLVRQEMGPDAIILSSQRTKEGVEIITSTDMDFGTRGGEEKKQFSRQFDEQLDQAFTSDQAWQAHQGVDQAAKKFAPPQRPLVDASRSERLAAEIDAARVRMEAAKLGQSSKSSRSSPKPRGPVTSGFVPVEAGQLPPQLADRLTQSRQDGHLPESQETAQAGVDRQMAGLQEQVAKMAQEQKRKEQEDLKLHSLRDEIADMRMLLEQQMWRMRDGPVASTPSASPLMDSLKDHLTALGLPGELVKKLALAAKPGQRLNAAWRSALAHLTKQVRVDNRDPISRGGVFAFVGPTGVGKTTTIAKLAARYVLQNGLGKVALITTDTYRVGAHDQLRSLGRILNVPVRVVDKERSLPSVLASLKDYPLILIDSAGFRQGDPLLKEQEALLDSCPGLQRLLVLACNSQRQTLKASAHAFSSKKLLGCIVTKVDETASLGELLGVLVQQRIPVLYSADGQAIPNDISIGSGATLVAKAVALMKLQRQTDGTFAAAQ